MPKTQAIRLCARHKRNDLSQILKHTLLGAQAALDFDGMPQRRRLIARLIVITLALIIIFIRMPNAFFHPAFWAEDGPLYFRLAYLDGWRSITTQTAGYLTLFQWLVGNVSTYFPVSMAPAIFTAVATALTLVVVWLVTSPRLPLPAKPLLALAVVAIPAGYELLGGLGNSQWIFPIGAFSILLMSPSKNRFFSCGEAAFVSIFSVTGPFSLLLLPVCGLLIILGRDGSAGKRRILILSGIIVVGATIEAIYILRNFVAALTPDLEPIPSSWQLWLVLPIARVTFPIGHHVLRTLGEAGSLPIALVAYGSIAYFALRAPYRQEKIAMLLFAFAIIISGMIKDRLVLPLNGMRYYYTAQVFAVWFFCCVPQTNRVREIFTGIVAIALLIMVLAFANLPRVAKNSEWPTWSKEIHSGLPVKIPLAPKGWFITLPANPYGPLARFVSWPGKEIFGFGLIGDDSACGGAVEAVESDIDVNGGPSQWIVRGWANSVDGRHAIPVVVLTNSENFVLGFGLPGFASGGGEMLGWGGVVQSPTPNIRAFAIVSGDRDALCPLATVSR